MGNINCLLNYINSYKFQ